jgi:hypothetical protein
MSVGLYFVTEYSTKVRDDYWLFGHYQSSSFFYRTMEVKLNSMALVRKQTIPTERPPVDGEISVNFRR